MFIFVAFSLLVKCIFSFGEIILTYSLKCIHKMANIKHTLAHAQTCMHTKNDTCMHTHAHACAHTQKSTPSHNEHACTHTLNLVT